MRGFTGSFGVCFFLMRPPPPQKKEEEKKENRDLFLTEEVLEFINHFGSGSTVNLADVYVSF